MVELRPNLQPIICIESRMSNPPCSPAALLIIAGPSCVGKTTLVDELLRARPELARPITTTTRAPRSVASGDPDTEIDGVHYHFRSEEEFEADVQRGEFLEHARYVNARYGLTRSSLEAVREAGRLPAVILDVQGVMSMTTQLPCATLFVSAPLSTLESRIRATRPAEQVASRLERARVELSLAPSFDYVLDNGDRPVDDAIAELLRVYDSAFRPRLAAYSPSRRARPVRVGR